VIPEKVRRQRKTAKSIQSSHRRTQSDYESGEIRKDGLQRRAGWTQKCAMRILDSMEQSARSRQAVALDQMSESRELI
jgi:hypothetical protein